MIGVCLAICIGVWVIGLTSVYQTFYRAEEVEVPNSWECESCGTCVEADTFELLVEGMRIHDIAVYCSSNNREGDWDD